STTATSSTTAAAAATSTSTPPAPPPSSTPAPPAPPTPPPPPPSAAAATSGTRRHDRGPGLDSCAPREPALERHQPADPVQPGNFERARPRRRQPLERQRPDLGRNGTLAPRYPGDHRDRRRRQRQLELRLQQHQPSAVRPEPRRLRHLERVRRH